ncbi:MAG: tetratricopeptide repeat protein [Candidatus Sumerlaeaceae bacterium]|nr:tetratricopeptide repeat protein [Candidatus Sumerlaeaceae bacterium]
MMSNRILRQAEKLVAGGQWVEACSLLEHAEKCESDPRLQLQRAVILLNNNQAGMALAVLEALIDKDPSYLPARLYAGIAAIENGDLEQAARILEIAMGMAPQNELVRCYWELAQLMSGNGQAARTLVWGEPMPANSGFLIRLTHWVETQWLKTGRFFAPRQLNVAEFSSPENKRFSKRAAIKAFRKRNFRQFLEIAVPSATNANASTELLFACAFACEMLNGFEDALFFLSQLEPEDQHAEPVQAARGRCLVRLGRYYEALDCLEKVLIVGPEDFGLNYYLGVLCLAHGDERRSRHFFERAYRDYFVDTFEYQFWQIRQALRTELETRDLSAAEAD